jgi:regulator of RNase E activity RraA
MLDQTPPQASTLSPQTMERLRSVSTATLTTQLFKRGFSNLFVQGVKLQTRPGANMVGPATTLRYIPAREDLDQLSVFEDRSHPQRLAVETIPSGHVLVMDTRGDTRAASAGHILLTRMQMRGAAGVVTDGTLRDLPNIAEMGWPVYAAGGAAPTNLIHHHAVDIDTPIACGDVPVYPGDIIVGDAEGVVVLPAHLAEDVAADAQAQERFEDFVLEEVRAGKSIFGIYPPDEETKRRYEALSGARPKTHG